MKAPVVMMFGAAALLLLVGLSQFGPSPAETPTIPAPSATLQEAVKPVTAALHGHPQAAELANCYRTLADVVGRDSTVIKTKHDLVRYLKNGVTLRFQGIFQKVPGLSDKIHGPTGVLMTHLGPDPGELDHAAAKQALLAIAWAATQ